MKVKIFFPLMILCIISCGVYSENPLSEINLSKTDKSLLGIWHLENDSESKFSYVVIREKDNNLYHFILINKEFELDENCIIGYIIEINNEKYLNMMHCNPSKDKNDRLKYIILHYKFMTNSKVIVSSLNKEFFKKAIKNKKIQGIPIDWKSNNEINSGICLTDSSKNITKLLSESNPNDFIDSKNHYIFIKIN